MDKHPTVVFRNVGQLYFPQTRVECHYSLTSEHQWSSGDWIGIFEMGWSSLKQYYTYTWALVPEGYTERTIVDYCALFQASYLPRPSDVEYQFVYVDKMGKVCSRSRPFIFCAPKPLEELETLKEEQDEEDGEEELMLVIPRAQLLQSRLEECLKKQEDLQQALDIAREKMEDKKEISKAARIEWESERGAMREQITELRDNLRHSCEMLRKMEEKHKDATYSQENLTSELSKLMAEKAENQQKIKDLENDMKVLSDKEKEASNELERVKERVKKTSSQMKHDEEKRKTLQAEMEASVVEVRGLQEHLEASDHVAESLRRELRELGTRQSHTHTELHQARLQVAQLTLQLSEEDLMLREERANSTLEREAYKHAAEIDKKKIQELTCELQRKEDWLQEERVERDNLETELGREKVLLKDAKRELQELRAVLRKLQEEREEEQIDKQARDLVNYIRQFEQKLGIVPETQPQSRVTSCIFPGSSSERDEDDAPSASSRSIPSPLFVPAQLEQPDRTETPAETHTQSDVDKPAFDTLDEKRQHCETQAEEGKQLILPELVNPVLSELSDSPMW
ncbi:calcium-binding and coiled-coil domain-containing protein 1-like [Leuresthes tenuis]|uniref:calcium-binding and coiled-coil domain-containing protein 1-like n=1 Tax=Leuresthes tenuis TaxID=355514 RepID=UPI003B512F8F